MFQNNSGLVIFICEKLVSRNQFDLMVYHETTFQFYRNPSGVLSSELFRFLRKIPEVPRTILAPSKNF
jgi:hypothetical protein